MESEAPMQSPVNLTGKVYLKGAACLAHVQAVHPAVTKSDLQSGLKTLMGSGSRDHLLTVIVPHAALSFHLAQYLSTRFLPATDDALSCKRWAKAMDERAVAIHSSLQRVERAPEVLVLDALLPRLLLLQKVTLKLSPSKAEVTAFATAIAQVKNLREVPAFDAQTVGKDAAVNAKNEEIDDAGAIATQPAVTLPTITLSHVMRSWDAGSIAYHRQLVIQACVASRCAVHRLECMTVGRVRLGELNRDIAAAIGQLSSLREMDLTGSEMEDGVRGTDVLGCPSSPKLPNLQRLNLSRVSVGKLFLESVAALPNLTALTMRGNTLLEPGPCHGARAPLFSGDDGASTDGDDAPDDASKTGVTGLLSRLFSKNADDALAKCKSSWAVLRRAKKLRHLDIEGSSISPEGLHAVMHIRTLETLFLGDVAPAVVEAVAGHPTLSTLSLNTIGLSQRLLDIIVGLPSLTSLSLYGLQIRDADLSGISRARDLKVFRAVGSPLRSAGLLALSDLRCLGELSVDVCPGDDAVLAELIPNMTSLRKIDVRGEQLCSTARAIKGRYPMLRRVVSNGERHRCFMES